MTDEELFRHLWTSYLSTIDGRQTNGDIELLAEAAERMEWPGAPEMGSTIASVLRAQVVKDKTGKASKHYKLVRDRQIFDLAQIHADQGMTQKDSHECIAVIFKIEPGAVTKAVTKIKKERGLEK
jgi:hypothetical protein